MHSCARYEGMIALRAAAGRDLRGKASAHSGTGPKQRAERGDWSLLPMGEAPGPEHLAAPLKAARGWRVDPLHPPQTRGWRQAPVHTSRAEEKRQRHGEQLALTLVSGGLTGDTEYCGLEGARIGVRASPREQPEACGCHRAAGHRGDERLGDRRTTRRAEERGAHGLPVCARSVAGRAGPWSISVIHRGRGPLAPLPWFPLRTSPRPWTPPPRR